MRQIRLHPAALLLLLGGCAGSMGPVISPPPAPPPVTAYDGVYRNRIQVLGSFNSDQVSPYCQTPGRPVITVSNGELTYAVPHPDIIGNPTPTYVAEMAADGSFHGPLVAGIMSGQVQGNRIEGKIDGAACLYTFTGNKG